MFAKRFLQAHCYAMLELNRTAYVANDIGNDTTKQ